MISTDLLKVKSKLYLQNVSNLWAENLDLLNLRQSDGVLPVSALAADALTENVFIITENHKLINDQVR